MIAQSLVEYAALHSIAASIENAYFRLENLLEQGNTKFFLFAALGILVILIVLRRLAGR